MTGIGGDRDGRLTIERCNRTGAAVETLHTFEWHEMSVSGARATFDKLAADTRGDSWLELRRGPLIELTTEWRVRTPTPAVRNAASLTSVKTMGGEEALVLFGGGVYPDTYYNDTHILHLEDLPAAAAAPEKPPPPLANLCQAAVAGEITDDNVFEMLVFADDRQLADLRGVLETRPAALEFESPSLVAQRRRLYFTRRRRRVASAVPEERTPNARSGASDAVYLPCSSTDSIAASPRRLPRRRRRGALEHAVGRVVCGRIADDLSIAAPRSSRDRQASTVAAQASKRAPSLARTTAQTASSSKISSNAAAWSAGTNGLARVSASKTALSASTSLMKCSSGSATMSRSAGVSQTSRQDRPYNASWPRDASS